MSDLEQSLGRRFARLDDEPRRRAARALAAVPPADPHAVRPVGSAVDVDALNRGVRCARARLGRAAGEPSKVLDLGTGTGLAAFAVARRFPGASVVGSDIAEEMLVQAREATPPELAERVRFEAADAARLPFPPALSTSSSLANMIPFFDELERVVAPAVTCSSRSREDRKHRSGCRPSASARSSAAADLRTLRTSRPTPLPRSLPAGARGVTSATKGRSRRGNTGPDVLSSRGHGYTSRPAAR